MSTTDLPETYTELALRLTAACLAELRMQAATSPGGTGGVLRPGYPQAYWVAHLAVGLPAAVLRGEVACAAAVRGLFDVQRDHHADPKVMGWLLRQAAEGGWSEEQLLGRPPTAADTAPASPRQRVLAALGPGDQRPEDT